MWCRGTGDRCAPLTRCSLLCSRMMDIAKAMRLKISKAKGLPGLGDDQNHKLGTLSLPLPVQKASVSQRKRKKMN